MNKKSLVAKLPSRNANCGAALNIASFDTCRNYLDRYRCCLLLSTECFCDGLDGGFEELGDLVTVLLLFDALSRCKMCAYPGILSWPDRMSH